jgi:hypothetical protein
VSKNCQITIWNEHDWELDDGMMFAVLQRLTHHVQQAEMIDVYPQERIPVDAPAWKSPGWLEWILRIKYRGGGGLTIGAIQRTVGAGYEFHS